MGSRKFVIYDLLFSWDFSAWESWVQGSDILARILPVLIPKFQDRPSSDCHPKNVQVRGSMGRDETVLLMRPRFRGNLNIRTGKRKVILSHFNLENEFHYLEIWISPGQNSFLNFSKTISIWNYIKIWGEHYYFTRMTHITWLDWSCDRSCHVGERRHLSVQVFIRNTFQEGVIVFV